MESLAQGWVGWFVASFLGLSVGSFANVAVYRIPREGLGVSSPARSFCPACDTKLTWFDNIPLISWIVLGGRCRSCKQRIPVRYPAVELLVSGGTIASSGAAAGPVFVVETQADAIEFPDGAVLLTVQPLPRWASLIGRAAAIVAEHGSMAGHLATVAREHGVPALFSVEGWANLFISHDKSGETVPICKKHRPFDPCFDFNILSVAQLLNPILNRISWQ